MRRIIVTVKRQGDNAGRDIEMPTDIPVRQLMPELVTLMGLPQERAAECGLRSESQGRVISPDESMDGVKARIGDRFTLLENHYDPSSSPVAAAQAQAEADLSGIPPGRTPYLVSEQGIEYPAPRDTVYEIGREDRASGIFPQIDLRQEDPNHYVHRQHARIIHERPNWYLEAREGLKPEETAVNGEPLPGGQRVVLRKGDRIRIAQVELVFRVG
jgi:hypothetical protein